MQTSFHLPPSFCGFELSLLFERGAHKPSSAECLAPFHQDCTQRIAALRAISSCIIFPVETLSRLAEGREGCEISWGEWKEHVVIPEVSLDFCVSGCRLFCITPGERYPLVTMEVYDYSMQGRAKYLSEQIDADRGGVRYLAPTGAVGELHWGRMCGMGHDGVVLLGVSVLLSCAMRSSDVSHSVVQEDVDSLEKLVLRICTLL